MSESKPREFWIHGNFIAETKCPDYVVGDAYYGKAIHVVEYQAYSKLTKALEELKELATNVGQSLNGESYGVDEAEVLKIIHSALAPASSK